MADRSQHTQSCFGFQAVEGRTVMLLTEWWIQLLIRSPCTLSQYQNPHWHCSSKTAKTIQTLNKIKISKKTYKLYTQYIFKCIYKLNQYCCLVFPFLLRKWWLLFCARGISDIFIITCFTFCLFCKFHSSNTERCLLFSNLGFTPSYCYSEGLSMWHEGLQWVTRWFLSVFAGTRERQPESPPQEARHRRLAQQAHCCRATCTHMLQNI